MEATVHLVQSEYPFLDVGLHLNPLPALMGYPAKLSQVFYNVLDNAAKAVAESGHIRINSRETDGFILITIEDSGCGIPEDILPQVFDPFFTTRGVGSGTGLGLSVARDIVTAHQGEILLARGNIRGTRVTLRFPVN